MLTCPSFPAFGCLEDGWKSILLNTRLLQLLSLSSKFKDTIVAKRTWRQGLPWQRRQVPECRQRGRWCRSTGEGRNMQKWQQWKESANQEINGSFNFFMFCKISCQQILNWFVNAKQIQFSSEVNLRYGSQEAHVLSKTCLVFKRGGVIELVYVRGHCPFSLEKTELSENMVW